MYRAYGLLTPGSDYTSEAMADRLGARFSGYSVLLNGPQIRVSKGDWEIELLLNEAPYVLNESEGIAAHLQSEDADVARGCARRVEVWSDTPDPFLEHFDEYLGVVGVLKSFAGVVAVDPKERNVI
jgi:hypothetical protein